MSLALAGCVLLNARGQLLLLHRATPKLTQWELPGGKIEPGEQPSATAVREVAEELGVDVAIVKDLGARPFDYDGRSHHYSWFLASISAGEPQPMEAKFDAVDYFDWASLPGRTDLSPNVINLIAVYPQGVKLG